MALFGLGKKKEKEEKKSDTVSASSEEASEATPSAPTKARTVRSQSQQPLVEDARRSYETVLLRPHITEKATFGSEKGAYVFEVSPSATRRDVAEAVRRIYRVVPRKVNMVTVPKKRLRSRMRGRTGTVSGGKKAYVYLKEGDTIDFV